MNDCETLIKHYDLTLEAWRERFLAKRKEMKDLFDEKFCKMWEFYLSSTALLLDIEILLFFKYNLLRTFQLPLELEITFITKNCY